MKVFKVLNTFNTKLLLKLLIRAYMNLTCSNNNGTLKKRNVRITLLLAIICTFLLFLDFLIVSLVYSINDWLAILVFSLILIFPAYFSNAGMVLLGGGKPIDGGKTLRDGHRILGDHKTWNGFLKGPAFIGIPISIILSLIFLWIWPYLVLIPLTGIETGAYVLYNQLYYYEYYFIGGAFPWGFLGLILRIFLCSYGAAIGDLLGSFLKRRFNIQSGEPFWIIDQLDFVVCALLFTIIPNLIFPSLFILPDVNIILFLIILTPTVSILSNVVAYFLNLKNVPW
ncbi:MAG: CDP-2,3-bis-(O-geranylgeranyl)-sn-glycerol synthase [Promethearchaeota archaeon]